MSDVSFVYGTNTELLGLFSQMVGDSAFITRTRATKDHSKLIVDVTEIYHEGCARPGVTHKFACNAARRFGATSMDHATLYDNMHSERKVTNGDGSESIVKTIRSSFVFDAALGIVVGPSA